VKKKKKREKNFHIMSLSRFCSSRPKSKTSGPKGGGGGSILILKSTDEKKNQQKNKQTKQKHTHIKIAK
jgi:mevalonate kinase